MGEDPIENMRFRAAQCRRLANSATTRELLDFLINSAEEIEADIVRPQQEREGRSNNSDSPKSNAPEPFDPGASLSTRMVK